MCWKTEVESVIRIWHSFSHATSDESELRVATSWSMILEVSCVLMKSTSRNQSSTNYGLSQGYYTCYILRIFNEYNAFFCLRNTIKIYVNGKSLKSAYTLAFKNKLLTSKNKTFCWWSGSWGMVEVSDDSLGSVCNKGSFVRCNLVLKGALNVIKGHLYALLFKESRLSANN